MTRPSWLSSRNPLDATFFEVEAARFISEFCNHEAWLVGVHIRLLCHQWINDGVADDRALIARFTGAPNLQTDDGAWALVCELFPVCPDGRRRNRWMEESRYEARERRAAKKRNRHRRAQHFASMAICDLTAEQWEQILASQEWRCAHCGTEDDLTQDHIVPVSRGGAHTASNIQALCRLCNSRKGASLEVDP